MKLNPPHINGTIPAFAGNVLAVPFEMNRSVGTTQIKAVSALIKTVQTNKQKAILTGHWFVRNSQYFASFPLADFDAEIGQYYKVQIAFVDSTDEVGYYSSVGVTKYTSYPSVEIQNLKDNMYSSGIFNGVFTQSEDKTELPYKYQFLVYDGKEVFDDSGEQFCNGNNYENGQYVETWQMTKEMQDDKFYKVCYKVTTNNGFIAESTHYAIIKPPLVSIDLPLVLEAENCFDEGVVKVDLTTKKDIEINGTFMLSRFSEKTQKWEDLYSFNYLSHGLKKNEYIPLFKDISLEQGVNYTYALQLYNTNGLRSERILSNTVYSDYEDIFISDGKKVLKVRFDPKINSFKDTILEAKVDTLGGKFPFFFRNGNTHYKEFPVGGLLSLIADDAGSFNAENALANDLRRKGTFSRDVEVPDFLTNPSARNMKRERDFKLEVLEWLTNGEIKLLKTAPEGVYFVRLLNVSLTPNDTLGRMLHSFSATAYQVAETDLATFRKFGYLPQDFGTIVSTQVGSIKLAETAKLPEGGVKSAIITDATPGTQLFISSEAGSEIVEIGYTGTYVLPEDFILTSVALYSGNWDEARLDYIYEGYTQAQEFSSISNIKLQQEFVSLYNNDFSTDIISNIETENVKFKSCSSLMVQKRNIVEIYNTNNGYSYDEFGLSLLEDKDWVSADIYYVINDNKYLDGAPDKEINGKPDFNFSLNNESVVDLSGSGNISGRIGPLNNLGAITGLRLGNGLIGEMAYIVEKTEVNENV